MISDYTKRVKSWIRENKSDLFTTILIFLIGMGSFGLGRLSILWHEKAPMEIVEQGSPDISYGLNASSSNQTELSTAFVRTPAGDVRGRYVASKSSSFYHYPWCPGAAKIKEGNKIT